MTDDNNPQLALIALSEAATPGELLVSGATVYALKHHGWKRGKETFCNATYASFIGDNSKADAEFVAALFNHFRATQSRPEAELPELPELPADYKRPMTLRECMDAEDGGPFVWVLLKQIDERDVQASQFVSVHHSEDSATNAMFLLSKSDQRDHWVEKVELQ